MIKHLALLRGINVGGKHMIKMDALKAAFEELGFTEVKTYIQSGNVVFLADVNQKASLKARIELHLNERFGFNGPVVLRTSEELRQRVADDPFASFDPEVKRYIYFLDAEPPEKPSLPTLVDKEGFQLIDICHTDALVVRHPVTGKDGYTDKSITKMLKGTYTARNWNTVVALSKL